MPDLTRPTEPTQEIAAMARITKLLTQLDDEARRRVVDWITDRYQEDDRG